MDSVDVRFSVKVIVKDRTLHQIFHSVIFIIYFPQVIGGQGKPVLPAFLAYDSIIPVAQTEWIDKQFYFHVLSSLFLVLEANQ